MKFSLQSKLGAWALIALLSLTSVPTVGCNGASAAQKIVNWTPAIDSGLTTLGVVASSLAPQDAAIIQPTVAGLVAAQNLLKSQAQTYLDNPGASTLQQLQAQAVTFQANVNTALLAALKITNPGSQQQIITQLNVALTGVSAILALIMTIKGSTVTPSSVTAPKLAQVLPLIRVDESVALIAQHEGISTEQALVAFSNGIAQQQAAGL